MYRQQRNLLFAILGISGMLSVSSFIQSYAQNYSSVTSTELKSIRSSLEQAITAFDAGNLSEALNQLDSTEDEIDIVEDRIEFELGIE
jgi:hypothetical protein